MTTGGIANGDAPRADPAPARAAAPEPLVVVLAIATTGRAAVLAEVLPHLARQTRPPDRFVLSASEPADVPADVLARLPFEATVIHGPRGLPRQRNAVLDRAADADVIVFIDDDFLMAPAFLAAAERFFAETPEAVAATGIVVADGINGPGLSFAEGLSLLEADPGVPADPAPWEDYGTYGCNMLVRGATVRRSRARFDERLPLYGWLEDIDFSRQLAAHGKVMRTPTLRGVHLGSKAARSRGDRLGYSQIANPVYLWRKGTVRLGFSFPQMVRNVAANLVGSLRPEPWVDRRGRLRGNLMALGDLARGRLHPERILDMA